MPSLIGSTIAQPERLQPGLRTPGLVLFNLNLVPRLGLHRRGRAASWTAARSSGPGQSFLVLSGTTRPTFSS